MKFLSLSRPVFPLFFEPGKLGEGNGQGWKKGGVDLEAGPTGRSMAVETLFVHVRENTSHSSAGALALPASWAPFLLLVSGF